MNIEKMIKIVCDHCGIEIWHFNSIQEGSNARGLLFYILHLQNLTDEKIGKMFHRPTNTVTQARNRITKDHFLYAEDIKILKRKIKIEDFKLTKQDDKVS